MTLRARLAILTTAAVTFAVLVASVAAWLFLRSTLMNNVDERLHNAVQQVQNTELPELKPPPGADEPPGGGTQLVGRLQGGDAVTFQVITTNGSVAAESGDVHMTLTDDESKLMAGSLDGPLLRTEEIADRSYRVLSTTRGDNSLVRVLQPLDNVNGTLTQMAWVLAGVTAAGVAVAGGLGWWIARAGLRPVERLTTSAQQVAKTKDLAHRIEIDGNERDEVATLARSYNAMLSALDQAQTQQRRLVEDAGHELRTPLATLRNDISVLLRAEHHPDRDLTATDRENLLRALESESAGLTELIGEIVDLARGEIEPEPLVESDLRALVDRAAARTRRVNPRVEITVEGSRFELPVRAAALERAVANVIRNAAQVSADGGLVEVELLTKGDDAIMRVRDRGPGIPAADLPRIFDRFYRGTGPRKRHGSGLGLAIAAQAMAQHDGDIKATNRSGGGAVFTLRIPRDPLRVDHGEMAIKLDE